MNKLSTLLLLVLVAVAMAQDEPTFADAKVKFGVKFVNAADEAYRESIFNTNLRSIRVNNANPNNTHKEGVNQFTFLSMVEFKNTFLGARPPQDVQLSALTPSLAWPPASRDWSTVPNVVTVVKNQGSCGSCWAFSAVAAIESLRFQAYRTIGANFSEQQLVSCSNAYGNQGCNGGWMHFAYNYVKAVGIVNESAYPYTSDRTGVSGTCKAVRNTFKISGYKNVSKNCDSVAAAVQVRPLSVAVDASNWSPYSSGILNSCGMKVNHAVLLVGVNSTTWKIKNSWGTGWGQSGYMLLDATNARNICNICFYANYPLK